MRIYCTRHDDIHRAGTNIIMTSAVYSHQPEIKPSNIIIII